MALQEPDYLDLNKANGKLDVKAGRKDEDARSDSNVRLHKPIEIVRPASAEGYDSHSLPSHSNLSSLQSHRRPQSGDWTHLPSSMESLTLDSLKEPSSSSSNGLSSRRHTVHIDQDSINRPKIPARTQAAIEKVAEIVTKMGGEVRTHVQDNGGLFPASEP